jgi:hypothetical protein
VQGVCYQLQSQTTSERWISSGLSTSKHGLPAYQERLCDHLLSNKHENQSAVRHLQPGKNILQKLKSDLEAVPRLSLCAFKICTRAVREIVIKHQKWRLKRLTRRWLGPAQYKTWILKERTFLKATSCLSTQEYHKETRRFGESKERAV